MTNSKFLDYQNPEFYYNQVVDLIAEDLMSRIKSYCENKNDYKCDFAVFWPYEVDRSAIFNYWPYYPPFLDVQFQIAKIKFPDDHPGWNVIGSASWGDDSNSIKIVFQFRKDLELSDGFFRILEREIVNVTAHEIHHLTQYKCPLQSPGCEKQEHFKTSQTHFEYFLEPREVSAFVMGFRAEMKKVGLEMSLLIDEYLANYVNAELITSEQFQIIKQTWLNFSNWSKAKQPVSSP